MSLPVPVRKQLTAVAFLAAFSAMAAGCGSSDDPASQPDSGLGGDGPMVVRDAPSLRDTVVLPDAGSDTMTTPVDLADASVKVPDAPVLADTRPEAALPRLDLPPQAVDGGSLDNAAGEAGRVNVDATADTTSDTTSARVDTGADSADAATSQPDVAVDTADAAFQPGPATALIVNSSNTAEYSLANGTWKLFYFEAEAGQLYVVSQLDGIRRGYLGTSASVSPSDYQMATDPQTGKLYLTAPTAQRYYLAVGVSGGWASGSFQVADGGKLLPAGTTTLSLTPADAGDAYQVFRFPITAGHGYVLNLQGPSQPNLGLAVAASPERSTLGEFSYSNWGLGGSLPFTNQAIPATMVATSTSGFYFVNIRVVAPITFTISIADGG